MSETGIGKPVRRVEDFRFLTGSGQYTADIDRPFSYEQLADDVAALMEHLGIEQAAERLLDAFKIPMQLEGRELRLQVSIGVTSADHPGRTSGELLRRADVAMYVAKRGGGGWVRYERGMSALLRRRMDLQR